MRRAENKELLRNPLEAIGTYLALGDSDHAITILQNAVNDRSTLPFVFVDPMVDPLRSDPRFQELLNRVGLPGETGRSQLFPSGQSSH